MNAEKGRKKRLESERTRWTVRTDVKRHKGKYTHILGKIYDFKGDG